MDNTIKIVVLYLYNTAVIGQTIYTDKAIVCMSCVKVNFIVAILGLHCKPVAAHETYSIIHTEYKNHATFTRFLQMLDFQCQYAVTAWTYLPFLLLPVT